MIAAVGIRQTDLYALTSPYDLGMSVLTGDPTFGFVASFELLSPDSIPMGTGNLSVPAPANGGSDTDTLQAGAGGGFTIHATANKSGGVATVPSSVIFYYNSSPVHTDNIGTGDPIAGEYTYTNVNPGDLFEVSIIEI